jgi:acyl-CoA reductase-like NAD-dependent aldehyde dehydrogenase
LKLANDTEYGLMSGVFTSDVSRALSVSAKLDSGVVGVNCVSYVSPARSKCSYSMVHWLTIGR